MKGQVFIEFITVFLLVFVIFIFLQANSILTTNSLLEKRTIIDAGKLLDESSELIDLTGHSTALSTQLYLPPFLAGGFNYSFTVSNTSVFIVWNSSRGQESIVRQIYTFNVTNATGATRFNLFPGSHWITKHSNGVRIT